MTASTVWSDEHFIAGDVALDFANTVYRRTPELGADLLGNAGDLTAWLAHAKLLPVGGETRDGFSDTGDAFGDPNAAFGDPTVAVNNSEVALIEARKIRQLFWVIFEAQAGDRELPAYALAGLLDIARRGIGGDVAVGPDGSTTPRTAQGGLTVLALRGIRLVLSPLSQPVRACDRCGWFFADTSRGRRRRWCSMTTCGNQAKAARFRATHP